MENTNQLERQVTELPQQVEKNSKSTANEYLEAIEETASNLKAHVHDIAQKTHAIVLNAERGITPLGNIDPGNKDEALHLFRIEAPK